jgi:hypothetical protein
MASRAAWAGGPVCGEFRVGGFGEARALSVVLVGVRARDVSARATWRAGLELEAAELAVDEHRALMLVILLLDGRRQLRIVSLRATATIAICAPRRALTRR